MSASKHTGPRRGGGLWDPTSVEEGNKAFFIRVWKSLPSKRILKTLWGSPKANGQRDTKKKSNKKNFRHQKLCTSSNNTMNGHNYLRNHGGSTYYCVRHLTEACAAELLFSFSFPFCIMQRMMYKTLRRKWWSKTMDMKPCEGIWFMDYLVWCLFILRCYEFAQTMQIHAYLNLRFKHTSQVTLNE